MTEQELRALVREAIARHVSGATGTSNPDPASRIPHPGSRLPPPGSRLPPPATACHAMFVLPESDGPCLIEPSVPCNHCGYCKSFGH